MLEQIKKDLKNGETWAHIRAVYGLKSDYLIRKARAEMGAQLKKASNYNYINIRISADQLKKLDNNALTSLCAYVRLCCSILKNKGLRDFYNLLKAETEARG